MTSKQILAVQVSAFDETSTQLTIKWKSPKDAVEFAKQLLQYFLFGKDEVYSPVLMVKLEEETE